MNMHNTAYVAERPVSDTGFGVQTYDLRAIADAVAVGMTVELARRRQTVHIDHGLVPAAARGDGRRLFAWINRALSECAGLSGHGATIRVDFDHDDNDVVVVILGENPIELGPTDMARVIGGQGRSGQGGGNGGSREGTHEVYWETGAGPTVILRLPLGYHRH
jgi:hypothetical protein